MNKIDLGMDNGESVVININCGLSLTVKYNKGNYKVVVNVFDTPKFTVNLTKAEMFNEFVKAFERNVITVG